MCISYVFLLKMAIFPSWSKLKTTTKNTTKRWFLVTSHPASHHGPLNPNIIKGHAFWEGKALLLESY